MEAHLRMIRICREMKKQLDCWNYYGRTVLSEGVRTNEDSYAERNRSTESLTVDRPFARSSSLPPVAGRQPDLMKVMNAIQPSRKNDSFIEFNGQAGSTVTRHSSLINRKSDQQASSFRRPLVKRTQLGRSGHTSQSTDHCSPGGSLFDFVADHAVSRVTKPTTTDVPSEFDGPIFITKPCLKRKRLGAEPCCGVSTLVNDRQQRVVGATTSCFLKEEQNSCSSVTNFASGRSVFVQDSLDLDDVGARISTPTKRGKFYPALKLCHQTASIIDTSIDLSPDQLSKFRRIDAPNAEDFTAATANGGPHECHKVDEMEVERQLCTRLSLKGDQVKEEYESAKYSHGPNTRVYGAYPMMDNRSADGQEGFWEASKDQNGCVNHCSPLLNENFWEETYPSSTGGTSISDNSLRPRPVDKNWNPFLSLVEPASSTMQSILPPATTSSKQVTPTSHEEVFKSTKRKVYDACRKIATCVVSSFEEGERDEDSREERISKHSSSISYLGTNHACHRPSELLAELSPEKQPIPLPETPHTCTSLINDHRIMPETVRMAHFEGHMPDRITQLAVKHGKGKGPVSKCFTPVKPLVEHTKPVNRAVALPRDDTFRGRPLHQLRLEDFKVNSETNQRSEYSFNQAAHGENERRYLPLYSRLDYCGSTFRKAIEIGGALESAPYNPRKFPLRDQEADRLIHNSYICDNIRSDHGVDAEKQEWLHSARSRCFGDMYGKPRQLCHRDISSPGFWRTDMPTTQEVELDKQAAQIFEMQRVETRRREAMLPGGRWRIRPE